MTNSRMTDPEVLEQRFPVLLRKFKLNSAMQSSSKRRATAD